MRRLAVFASCTFSGVELPESVVCESCDTEVLLDEPHDVRPDRADVSLSDVGNEHGEERPGVREQEALPTVDPQQVHVPVVGRRWHFGEVSRGDTEERQHLRRTAEDHQPPASTQRRDR
jgi:hypothetical protein